MTASRLASKPIVNTARSMIPAQPIDEPTAPKVCKVSLNAKARATAPDTRGLIAAVRLWEESQRYRIRVGNLIGAIERSHAAVPIELGRYLEILTDGESGLAKLIKREWRKHPLAPWAKSVRGLGEHHAAVLVAMLDGDPYVAYPKRWEGPGRGNHVSKSNDETPARTTQESESRAEASGRAIQRTGPRTTAPARILVADPPFIRTPGQLWQYCGVGALGKRTAGMSQEDALALGKPMLKSRVWQIAGSFLKAKNETYRAAYDAERVRVENRVHDKPCPPCHAKAGDPWRDGHKHASGLRVMAKQFLLDLWLESKRLHEEGRW